MRAGKAEKEIDTDRPCAPAVPKQRDAVCMFVDDLRLKFLLARMRLKSMEFEKSISYLVPLFLKACEIRSTPIRIVFFLIGAYTSTWVAFFPPS